MMLQVIAAKSSVEGFAQTAVLDYLVSEQRAIFSASPQSALMIQAGFVLPWMFTQPVRSHGII
jgi:hypothetical protein